MAESIHVKTTEQDYEIELIRSNRRSIALQVYPDGRIVCRAPRRATKREIIRFLDAHADWIAGALGAQPGMKQQTFLAESAPVLCLNDQGGQVMNCSVNITGTLRAQERGHQPLVYENHGIFSGTGFSK